MRIVLSLPLFKVRNQLQNIVRKLKTVNKGQNENNYSGLKGNENYLLKTSTYPMIKNLFAIVAIFFIVLSSVKCSNLQAESQSTLCPAQLKTKVTNSLNTSIYLNAFRDLSVAVARAPNAQTVVDHLASYPKIYKYTFFAFAQALYQAEVDYNALSPEVISVCDQQLDYAYCASTCFNSYPSTNCQQLGICNPADICGQIKRLQTYVNYSDIGDGSEEFMNQLWSFSLNNPFQNIEVCFSNMPDAFAQHDCETQYVAITNLIMQSVSIADYAQDISTTSNPVLQLQKTYLLSRFRFGHDIAKISMACRSFLVDGI